MVIRVLNIAYVSYIVCEEMGLYKKQNNHKKGGVGRAQWLRNLRHFIFSVFFFKPKILLLQQLCRSCSLTNLQPFLTSLIQQYILYFFFSLFLFFVLKAFAL